ncbi:MAG: septation protein IspZ [Proteobacteria bacterium]|nr:septation protein IspZ [Pseudomonadota bacterium]
MNALLEFAPIFIFFITYKYAGILAATVAILVATIVTLPLQFMYSKRISWGVIIGAGILALFASLTIYSGDPVFIKMKPTIVYVSFCCILLGGLFFNKVFLRQLFHQANLRITDKGWRQATLLWVIFFLLSALTNEFIWRNYDEATWVMFKVFGMLPLTFLCGIGNVFIFYKHSEAE